MTQVPSLTYAGGELAPGLYGRVDLNKYSTGVKKAKNFMVSVEGGLDKRYGMYFVGKPKYQNREAKLVPWTIAPDDSYIMEFGHKYIRFIRLGGYVMYPPGHVPGPQAAETNVDGYLEIASSYDENHVHELKFSFANDIVYIFHKDYIPTELRRVGLYDWTFSNRYFNPEDLAPTGLTVTHQVLNGGMWIEQTDPAAKIGDEYDPAPKWLAYKISATMPNGLETLVSSKVEKYSDLGYHKLRNKLTWDARPGAEQYTIYKGANGIYGFIGYVQPADGLEFIDSNFAPSFDVVPTKPFAGFGAGEYPRVGQFYKQRMGYAGTRSATQKLWFSKPVHFSSLSTSVPSLDDDAIEVELVGNSRHTINHMLQLKKFIIFTDSAEWIIHTADNKPLTPSTIDPVIETSYGSDPYLQPLAIGDRVLFVQNISGTIRDMGYEFTSDAFKADDLSRLARHLFENKSVIAWDYSAFPNNLVYTVCDDGTMPFMTYVREHEIWGWGHTETDGQITDVATAPEINQHATYFQTVRIINNVATRFIERTEVNFSAQIEDMFFVDCGLSYRDERYYTNLVRLSDTQVQITLPGHARNAGDEIQIENTDFRYRTTVVGISGDNLICETKYNKKIPGFLATKTGSAFMCSSHFSGFEHLANTTGNVVLADGAVFKDISIDAAGELELPIQTARLHCGRPYESEIVTLDLDDERVAGKYIEKTITDISIRLKDSRGVLVGSVNSPRELLSIPSRNVEDYDQLNSPLNGVYTIPSHTAWDKTAGVRVLAPDPLPCRVLNIIPDIVYGN